ncbi:hypothetical protein [Nostocoides sp. Soil756]|uniref:hypothetical protein n=1 Tax=Nostocoides sp. Soil756 TaxID=1736399 RepID=UPI0006FC7331|nr:hypothetical protein [Tetrasphaera sp. Soil756]KRE61291.1 hypothetical protein ASG78_13285 [Tetrasphaera sp. Soil756]
MPPVLPPLPPGPLSLDAARDLGLADHQWRMPQLLRTTRSVRSTAPLTELPERAAAFALALPPDVAFSHVTAARLWGLPLPAHLEEQGDLDVIRDTGRGRIERRGCISHRGLEHRVVASVQGLRVTALADTWVDLGEVVRRGLGRDDLVVVGDVVATRLSDPQASGGPPRALADALAARVRPRHASLLGDALTLVRRGVRSPAETRARLMFHDAGFPEPEVNAPLHAAGGGWLAEGDLVWRAQRVVGEYQGAVHAGIRRRSEDSYRNGLLGDEGWTVLELFAQDLVPGARRVATLRRFARALELDPARLRIH